MVVATKLPLGGAVRYPSQTRRAFENFVLIFLSVGIVALYSSYRRPIWIDEMWHFAWGGISDPLLAAYAVVTPLFDGTARAPYTESWLYFLWNIPLLEIFGANSVALRLPSLLAGIALLWLSIYFLRLKGLGFGWQILALCGFMAQTPLMYFAGEARTYMPLTAAVVGIALYFSSPVETRSTTAVRVVGFTSGIIGALLHTYVLMYAGILAATFAFIYRRQRSNAAQGRRTSFLANLGIPLLLTIGVIGVLPRFITFLNTWVFQSAEPYWEETPDGPWRFLQPLDLPYAFLYAHFAFAPKVAVSVPIGLGVFLLVLYYLRRKNLLAAAIVPPVALIFSALVASIAITAASVVGGYWVLTKQWVASFALVLLGCVWLCGVIFHNIPTSLTRHRGLLVAGSAILILATVSPKVYEQVQGLEEFSLIAETYRDEWAGTTSQDGEVLWGVEDVQNINIYLGGPVWPINACFSPVWQNCPAD